jgi:hypothetical protein
LSSMLWAAAAAAANPAPATAEEVLERARTFYSLEQEAAQVCPEASGDEIVVCGEDSDPERYRVPSDTDRGVVRDEVPRAPDLEPKYPGVAVAKGCFIGPCPKPMPVMIDLKAIPEAPEGSDADRIAKGEMAAP